VGLTLEELARRTGRPRAVLAFVLSDEVQRGRVLRLSGGRFALVPGSFSPATLAGLRGLSAANGAVRARTGEVA
jgi:hypothetical protein